MGSIFSLFSTIDYHPTLHFATTSAELAVRVASGSEDAGKETLQTFIESRCPSLRDEFRPPWWLNSGHLQTAYAVVGDFSKIDKVEYDRTFLRTLDGGTIGLDVTPSASERTLRDDAPILVVLHGLTGGSHESYVRAVLAPACTPVENGGLGFRGIVVNFRGCAGVPVTSPQLYSAGHTDDIRVAVLHIANRYPHARLLGIGFSLGANVLTRYLAEEGKHSRLAAGCAVACPWDLTKNAEQLENKWFHRNVYSKAMARNLQKLMARHASSLLKFVDHPLAQVLPKILVSKSVTLSQFDGAVTRIAGGSSPPFPFETAWDYYAWGSSHEILANIRVPFLALNSEDDPVVQVLPYEAGGNPWVAFAITEKGGHLGWFEQSGEGQIRRWIRKPVLEWLRATGEDLIVSDQGARPMIDMDGFLQESGWKDIGCQVIEGTEHIIGVEGEGGLLAGL